MNLHCVRAGVLDIAYLDEGPDDGPAVVLVHGFPYDVHAYDKVVPSLVHAGCRVIVPWLRGFGPTRFIDEKTPRSGQQAAIAADLLALMQALGLNRPVLAGYDWGGRAACIVAALWPESVRALLTCGGYQIQDIAQALKPAHPDQEMRLWYQYYFHNERGRAGLTQNRQSLCRLLWKLWSPDWAFHEATWLKTAPSLDNPDFVAVAIHSYRHRYGFEPGDPAYEAIERQLALRPAIHVPTISLDGASDGVAPAGGSEHHRPLFTAGYEARTLERVGHNVPQEVPQTFAQTVLELYTKTSE
jgi:pimeloyl-ACP methyl ester carboxylesterase